MNFLQSAFSVLLLVVLSGKALGATVLLTAYEPWNQRLVNNSAVVVESIKALNSKNTSIDIRVCILPVKYDQGLASVEACLRREKVKPDLVVSLGESKANLRLETAFFNKDRDAFADSAGQIRSGSKILPNGPDFVRATLPLGKMFCAGSKINPVESSRFLTLFVCNNTSYLLGNYFSPLKIPFGFVHVPDSTVLQIKSLDDKIVRSVNEMILAANKEANAKRAFVVQPYDLPETTTFLSANGKSMSSCEKAFYKQLGDIYSYSGNP